MGGAGFALLSLLAFGGIFICGILAVIRPTTASIQGWKRWLLIPLVPFICWTAIQTLTVIVQQWPQDLRSVAAYGSDEMYFAHANALFVLHGQNPYQGDHLAATIQKFHIDSITIVRHTPFNKPLQPPNKAQVHDLIQQYLTDPKHPPAQIEPATTHSYPAFSFLIAIPAVWFGFPSIAITQVVGLLALIALILHIAPPTLRLPIGLICLLDVDGIRSVASSDFAIWTTVGIVLIWWLRDHPWAAAMALGIVCAIQQTAWFAAPFLLIYIYQQRGWLQVLREGTLAISVFVAVNLPWIIASPLPWLRSLTLPMTLPLFPDGSGFIRLALSGGLPLWAPIIYSGIEFGLWLALLVGYTRWVQRWPLLGMILPLLPLLFAWRSPSRYFILLPFVVIAAFVLTEQQRSTTEPIQAL